MHFTGALEVNAANSVLGHQRVVQTKIQDGCGGKNLQIIAGPIFFVLLAKHKCHHKLYFHVLLRNKYFLFSTWQKAHLLSHTNRKPLKRTLQRGNNLVEAV